jgi:hypothetical protein
MRFGPFGEERRALLDKLGVLQPRGFGRGDGVRELGITAKGPPPRAPRRPAARPNRARSSVELLG